jgi:hypothetical protein
VECLAWLPYGVTPFSCARLRALWWLTSSLTFGHGALALRRDGLKPSAGRRRINRYEEMVLIGGLIGVVIVDPLTWAMYNLTPEQVQQPLTPTQGQTIHSGKGLMVVLTSDLTDDEKQAMVRIN